jgi:hypothetical protein
MRKEHKKTWSEIRTKAFHQIQQTPDMWRDWNNAKTESDRELLIIEMVWSMAYTSACEYMMDGGGITIGR